MAKQKEIVITRLFDAPRAKVWKAWTDTDSIRKWWGPKDFTCPIYRSDLRVGGKFLYDMRSPDGQDYWGTGVYREIVPLERIVVSDSFADEKGNVVPASHYGLGDDISLELEVIVTFADEGGKTRMTLRHIGFSEGRMREMAEEGWNQSFDKLAASLK